MIINKHIPMQPQTLSSSSPPNNGHDTTFSYDNNKKAGRCGSFGIRILFSTSKAIIFAALFFYVGPTSKRSKGYSVVIQSQCYISTTKIWKQKKCQLHRVFPRGLILYFCNPNPGSQGNQNICQLILKINRTYSYLL